MFLRDLLFPKLCLGCGYLGSYICLNCQKKLILIKDDRCVYCHKLSRFGLTHFKCRSATSIDGFMALYQYNYFLQKIIKAIKYRLATDIWGELSNLIYLEAKNKLISIKSIISSPNIQPIPLHQSRKNCRGFNQAEFVAIFLQSIIGGRVVNILERSKNTPFQAEIKDFKRRRLNIKGAFYISKTNDVRNKKIIIVDDVATSVATVKEAATRFKKHGAQFVYSIVLAKG